MLAPQTQSFFRTLGLKHLIPGMFQDRPRHFANDRFVLHQKNGWFGFFCLAGISFRVSRRCVHDPIAWTLVATLRITALTNAGSVPVSEKRPGMGVTFGRASGYEKKAKAGATARARSDRDNSCFEVRIREEASFADNCGYGILLCNAISSAVLR